METYRNYYSYSVLSFYNIYEVLNNGIVYILASKLDISTRGEHRENVVLNLQDGDIERSATKVKD